MWQLDRAKAPSPPGLPCVISYSGAPKSAACTNATITATFTLGAWSRAVTATVYLVRPVSLSVSAALYPSCSGGSVATLYTLGCADPPVRQRVRFSAAYELEADNASYALSGSVALGHLDVVLSRTNLQLLSGVDVHEGGVAGEGGCGQSRAVSEVCRIGARGWRRG